MLEIPEVEAARASADNVPSTLRALKNHYALADTHLADLAGIGRATVANKLKGSTACTAEELAVFAAVFGVPIGTLYAPRGEALRWLLDNPEIESRAPAARAADPLRGGPVMPVTERGENDLFATVCGEVWEDSVLGTVDIRDSALPVAS